MPIPTLISQQSQIKFISNAVIVNRRAPFLNGDILNGNSAAGTTLYGAQHPGSLSVTKYARFQATSAFLAAQSAYILPTAMTAPQNTTGGALAAANQLRVVAMVDLVPKLRLRGDQAPTAGTFIVAAGGGTAVADATIIVNGVNALASATVSLKSTGADTLTVLIGDSIAIAGDSTTYIATAASTAFNGTTGVAFAISPNLQKATVGSEIVTIATPANKSIIFGDAVGANALVEVCVLDAADVETSTGGALTAGREYEITTRDFMHTAGAVSLLRLMTH